MRAWGTMSLWVALTACHGRETDEILRGLQSENAQLRGEAAALRAENAVLADAAEFRWPNTLSVKRVGGDDGRLMFRRECPYGQALKGFAGRTGSVIDALVPVCAPVAPPPGSRGNRALERELAIIGGRGGKDATTLCPEPQLMVGLRGRAAEVIDALEPICEAGKAGARIGGEGGRDYERWCPAGWLAVGVTGRMGDYVESLSLTCADPTPLRGVRGPSTPADATVVPEKPAPAVPTLAPEVPAPAVPTPPEATP